MKNLLIGVNKTAHQWLLQKILRPSSSTLNFVARSKHLTRWVNIEHWPLYIWFLLGIYSSSVLSLYTHVFLNTWWFSVQPVCLLTSTLGLTIQSYCCGIIHYCSTKQIINKLVFLYRWSLTHVGDTSLCKGGFVRNGYWWYILATKIH